MDIPRILLAAGASGSCEILRGYTFHGEIGQLLYGGIGAGTGQNVYGQ